MLKEWIGKQSNPIKNTIEAGAVKKFALAIGDDNPLYTDAQAANESRYGGLIAPPTYPFTLDYGKIEGLPLPSKGLIHGEQIFSYDRPLQIGEDIFCFTMLADVYDKEGSNGTMTFVVTDRVGEDVRGERVFTARSITVIMGAVRKGMEQ
jgi:acyl dehydratase